MDFSGCTFKSTDQKSILFIEVNVSLSVTGVMNVEDDLFSQVGVFHLYSKLNYTIIVFHTIIHLLFSIVKSCC